MTEVVNIYCDESCHLEHDASQVMVLGAVWCPAGDTRRIAEHLRGLKALHGLSPKMEIKWTKVSPAKLKFYQEVLDFFFEDNNLHFRAVVIPDKTRLDHASHGRTHDDWYYEVCVKLLEPLIDPAKANCIYMDIKDTRSEAKRVHLEKVLRAHRDDHTGDVVKRVQQIRSHESEVLQLADLLIGALGHANRKLASSAAKQSLVSRLRRKSKKNLEGSTWMRESKFALERVQPKPKAAKA